VLPLPLAVLPLPLVAHLPVALPPPAVPLLYPRMLPPLPLAPPLLLPAVPPLLSALKHKSLSAT
jgi:hypothetical protein